MPLPLLGLLAGAGALAGAGSLIAPLIEDFGEGVTERGRERRRTNIPKVASNLLNPQDNQMQDAFFGGHLTDPEFFDRTTETGRANAANVSALARARVSAGPGYANVQLARDKFEHEKSKEGLPFNPLTDNAFQRWQAEQAWLINNTPQTEPKPLIEYNAAQVTDVNDNYQKVSDLRATVQEAYTFGKNNIGKGTAFGSPEANRLSSLMMQLFTTLNPEAGAIGSEEFEQLSFQAGLFFDRMGPDSKGALGNLQAVEEMLSRMQNNMWEDVNMSNMRPHLEHFNILEPSAVRSLATGKVVLKLPPGAGDNLPEGF